MKEISSLMLLQVALVAIVNQRTTLLATECSFLRTAETGLTLRHCTHFDGSQQYLTPYFVPAFHSGLTLQVM